MVAARASCRLGGVGPGQRHRGAGQIVLTASNVIIMPALGIAKRRLGGRLDSAATAGEGIQNLMCAAQAAAVLVGLAVVAIWPGGWPIDPGYRTWYRRLVSVTVKPLPETAVSTP